MNLHLQSKKVDTLHPTDILFQTNYWSRVKCRLGWNAMAFDVCFQTVKKGDILVLIGSARDDLKIAYVPQGPEFEPDAEMYGTFLEILSQALKQYLDSSVAVIRYDLPWKSQYAIDFKSGKFGLEHPSARLRELRMNIGTQTWHLRKAPLDLTVADTLIIDLTRSREDILAAMKPKTRYNIKLSRRKGVCIFDASIENLPLFYELYLQTAERNGFKASGYVHFDALFSSLDCKTDSVEIFFLLAKQGMDTLTGAIIAISGRRASYLFGASSNQGRHLMAPYVLHWEVIKRVQKKGCLTYDMGSVSPSADPNHPFYGMYRFKTGFGGEIVHLNGSWDYPLDDRRYEDLRNYESFIAVNS